MQVEELHTTEEINKTALRPAQWVQLYADDFFRFALSRVFNRELAEDLVQDTFLSGLQAMAQYRGDSQEKTWLMAILKNKITDHFRKSKKGGIAVSINGDTIADSDPYHFFFNEKGHWHKHMAPEAWSGEAAPAHRQPEFFRILQACLRKLNDTGQTVFQLKYFDEKKTGDICKDLSISASNYWVIIHRAKLQLRACLDKNWFSN